MTTKMYDDALNFMPAAKSVKSANSGRGILAFFKLLGEAFTDARAASNRYDTMVARGVPAGRAARMAFNTVYEQK